METQLALLKADGVLDAWSDECILPGQDIPNEIPKRMKISNIFAFLVSPDFLASSECREEWRIALNLAESNPGIFLIPIILRPCPWDDHDEIRRKKALPKDGKAISKYSNRDVAWNEIYKGLKEVIEELRAAFTIRPSFRKRMSDTEFISQDHIPLDSIFVFPQLIRETPTATDTTVEKRIAGRDELLSLDHVLIRGEQLSGKTALCRHLLLSVADAGHPAIYVDLSATRSHPRDEVFAEQFHSQYTGDYGVWSASTEKTAVILDNLSRDPRTLDYVTVAMQLFDRVIVTVSESTFHAYYRDEPRLADFATLRIDPLTHNKQERLIRHRLDASDNTDSRALDGDVDQLENRVNALVRRNRLLPRYPFYVLTILQTYEGFLPRSVEITSYGHCFRVLIISHLVKSGVSAQDAELEVCFNFAEHLAFAIYSSTRDSDSTEWSASQFEAFVEAYRRDYLIKDSILNRIQSPAYGILTYPNPGFRDRYMYHFFLGSFLAKHTAEFSDEIDHLIDKSYLTENYLTLMFTIHHASDNKVLEDIVARTKQTLNDTPPACLDKEEAAMFEEFVGVIPAEILSEDSIEEERKKERRTRDEGERLAERTGDDPEDAAIELVNDVYRIMKNCDVLGQILKNKYGVLRREELAEILATIADGGLRLVRLVVLDEEELRLCALAIRERFDEPREVDIENLLRAGAFFWTMIHIEKVVATLNSPELREIVDAVAETKGTPAYELIRYFLRLDTARELSDGDCREMTRLLKENDYPFIQKVVSLRTQLYMNTHRIKTPLKQKICAALGIPFSERYLK